MKQTEVNPYLNKISVNQEFKSYRDQCRTLGEEVKRGNSQKSQETEWKRFFDWEKVDGSNRRIITKIYEVPKEKTVQHGGEREIISYLKHIETVIINLLVQAKDNHIMFPKSLLFELLHMVNPNYKKYNFNTNELSEKTNISKGDIDEFYASTNRMLKGNHHRALDSLKRKNMIFWKLILMVKVNEDDEDIAIYREATNNEYEFIMQTRSNVLKEMNLTEEWQVFLYDRWDEYQIGVNRILQKELSIEFAYEAYDIKLNREKIKDEWFKLDADEKIIKPEAINSGVLERVLSLAKRRKDTALNVVRQHEEKIRLKKAFGTIKDENTTRRISEDYLYNQKQLGKMLISLNSEII